MLDLCLALNFWHSCKGITWQTLDTRNSAYVPFNYYFYYHRVQTIRHILFVSWRQFLRVVITIGVLCQHCLAFAGVGKSGPPKISSLSSTLWLKRHCVHRTLFLSSLPLLHPFHWKSFHLLYDSQDNNIIANNLHQNNKLKKKQNIFESKDCLQSQKQIYICINKIMNPFSFFLH